MREIILMACVMSFFSSVAVAGNTSPYEVFTGESLLKACDGYGVGFLVVPALSREQGVCEGYILGVVESMPNNCIPEATEKLTIVSTVRSYLKRNENQLSDSAHQQVSQAITNGWLCE